jgi:hypothetical protein
MQLFARLAERMVLHDWCRSVLRSAAASGNKASPVQAQVLLLLPRDRPGKRRRINTAVKTNAAHQDLCL